MSDFMLEPNKIESKRPERGRPVRMVSTGLAPTAAVPPSVRRGKEPVPCYAPCEACGAPVFTGSTPIGIRLASTPSTRRISSPGGLGRRSRRCTSHGDTCNIIVGWFR